MMENHQQQFMQQRKTRKADLPVVSSLRPVATNFFPSPIGTPKSSPLASRCTSPLTLSVGFENNTITASHDIASQRSNSWGSASFCSNSSIWSNSVTSSTWSLDSDSTNDEDGYSLIQNYLFHKYERVRDRALNEQKRLGPGNSALMQSMYDFWVHRLKHKFNKVMYQTFKLAALDDAAHQHYYGVDQLFIFYRASLSGFYRDKVFSDFVDIVAAQYHLPHSGLEQLWIFLRDMPKAIRIKCSRSVLPRMYKNTQLVAGLKDLDAFDFDASDVTFME